MKTLNIGVIYSKQEFLTGFYAEITPDPDKPPKIKLISSQVKEGGELHRVELEYLDISHTVPQAQLNVRFVYTFHKITCLPDAYALNDKKFDNFRFCGDIFSADVLNYLQSRIRRVTNEVSSNKNGEYS